MVEIACYSFRGLRQAHRYTLGSSQMFVTLAAGTVTLLLSLCEHP